MELSIEFDEEDSKDCTLLTPLDEGCTEYDTSASPQRYEAGECTPHKWPQAGAYGPQKAWRVLVYPPQGIVPEEWAPLMRKKDISFWVPGNKEGLIMFLDTFEEAQQVANQFKEMDAVGAVVERTAACRLGIDELVVCRAVPYDAQERYAAAALVPWRQSPDGEPIQLLMEHHADGWGWLGGIRQGNEDALETATRGWRKNARGGVVPLRMLRRWFPNNNRDSHGAVGRGARDTAVLWLPTYRQVLFVFAADGVLTKSDLSGCRELVAWRDVDKIGALDSGTRKCIVLQKQLLAWLRDPQSLASRNAFQCRKRPFSAEPHMPRSTRPR